MLTIAEANEHDFGRFEFQAQTINSKIDSYADETLEWGAETEQKVNNTCYRLVGQRGVASYSHHPARNNRSKRGSVDGTGRLCRKAQC